MKLYDETIKKMRELLEKADDIPLSAVESRTLPVGDTGWPEVSDRSMILRSDMAYELGGEGLPAIGCTMITADASLVPADEITLLGRDLNQ